MIRDFIEGIMNGLKRAVLFVVDVLLFIPKLLINGIKGFCAEEVKASPVEEDDDEEDEEEDDDEDDEEDDDEDDEEDDCEIVKRKIASIRQPLAKTPIAVLMSSPTAAAAEPEIDNNNKKEDESLKSSETDKPEEIAKEANQEETSVEPTTDKVEVTQKQQKQKTNKKTSIKSTKTEKVAADIVDNQSGEVVKESVNVETTTSKEMPVFGKTDKKAAPLEKGFITYFNNAVKKYNKSQWLDGATEIQKFARAYLDAVAIKENINAPKDETRYDGIMKALKDAKIMSDADEKFAKSCLGKQYFQGTENVQGRLNAVYAFMANYQLYYYPEWCASVKPQPFNGETVTA